MTCPSDTRPICAVPPPASATIRHLEACPAPIEVLNTCTDEIAAMQVKGVDLLDRAAAAISALVRAGQPEAIEPLERLIETLQLTRGPYVLACLASHAVWKLRRC
jgi:hypothetical protein